MQITSQSSNSGDTKEIVQALLLKKALQADGQQKLRILESVEPQGQPEADTTSKVGRYLDAKA